MIYFLNILQFGDLRLIAERVELRIQYLSTVPDTSSFLNEYEFSQE